MRVLRMIVAAIFLEGAILLTATLWEFVEPWILLPIGLSLALAILIQRTLKYPAIADGVKAPLLVLLGCNIMISGLFFALLIRVNPFASLFFIIPFVFAVWGFVKVTRCHFHSPRIKNFALLLSFILFALVAVLSLYAGIMRAETCATSPGGFMVRPMFCFSPNTPTFWDPTIFPFFGSFGVLGLGWFYVIAILLSLVVIPIADVVDALTGKSTSEPPAHSEPMLFTTKEKWTWRTLIVLFIIINIFAFIYGTILFTQRRAAETPCPSCSVPDKPVIYLYPTSTEPVSVTLNYSGTLTSVYPKFATGTTWEVTAHPDGTLIDKIDNQPYSYLFWEGWDTHHYNLSTGFVVKGSDTATFLQSHLATLGLTPREYNEMIVYWLPKMEYNPYNLIYFAGSDYTDTAQLIINPTPDAILRVFMVWKALPNYESIAPETLSSFTRTGFTVVEWGGTQIQ